MAAKTDTNSMTDEQLQEMVKEYKKREQAKAAKRVEAFKEQLSDTSSPKFKIFQLKSRLEEMKQRRADILAEMKAVRTELKAIRSKNKDSKKKAANG